MVDAVYWLGSRGDVFALSAHGAQPLHQGLDVFDEVFHQLLNNLSCDCVEVSGDLLAAGFYVVQHGPVQGKSFRAPEKPGVRRIFEQCK